VNGVVIYRRSCPKCRILSAMTVLASFGTIRRAVLGSDEAERLTGGVEGVQGKLIFITRGQMAYERKALIAVGLHLVQSPYGVVAAAAARLHASARPRLGGDRRRARQRLAARARLRRPRARHRHAGAPVGGPHGPAPSGTRR